MLENQFFASLRLCVILKLTELLSNTIYKKCKKPTGISGRPLLVNRELLWDQNCIDGMNHTICSLNISCHYI